MLLDLGSSANYKDSNGLTALYAGVTSDVTAVTLQRCVDMLLYDHATLGVMDSAGWTELHQVDPQATANCYVFICIYLL